VVARKALKSDEMLAAAGLTSSAPPQTVSCDPRAKKAQHCLGTPELQKGQNSKAGTALDKILFRIWYLCWNLTFISNCTPASHTPTTATLIERRFQ
jgi:hypothetical protein